MLGFPREFLIDSLATKIVFGFSVVATSLGVGCDARTDKDVSRKSARHTAPTAAPSIVGEADVAPRLLYLPDGDDVAYGSEFVPIERERPAELRPKAKLCPPDMVDVAGSICNDRYEAHLLDSKSGKALSPYYPPEPGLARRLRDHWAHEQASVDGQLGRELEIPQLPEFQLSGKVELIAVASVNVVPSGYVDGLVAESACKNAGKRLCKPSEWVTACRGEKNQQFPYGDKYVQGACNVFREAHPAQLLHGNASEGHLDPRLNLVASGTGPLLRLTGETRTCRSAWGNDAVFDMVGNLDEWVDDENGAFHGGFYARSTKLGCDARISSHPRPYEDYSLGVRCCK